MLSDLGLAEYGARVSPTGLLIFGGQHLMIKSWTPLSSCLMQIGSAAAADVKLIHEMSDKSRMLGRNLVSRVYVR